jgi:hypothetical protein
VRLGSFGEREEKKTERERMINSNCNPARVNKTLLDPSLTDKREYSNFKKKYSVENLTSLVRLGQKGAECQLFLKSWNGVSFPETRVCRV